MAYWRRRFRRGRRRHRRRFRGRWTLRPYGAARTYISRGGKIEPNESRWAPLFTKYAGKAYNAAADAASSAANRVFDAVVDGLSAAAASRVTGSLGGPRGYGGLPYGPAPLRLT